MFSREMMKALEADGEKLRQLTGEDHGPVFLPELGCEHCAPDAKSVGPGWIEQPNNGPIQSCPICNPEGRHLVKDF